MNQKHKRSTEKNLIGLKFGRLTVTGKSDRRYYWRCICDCGQTRNVAANNLKSGATKSCGCIRAERNNHTTHGGTGTFTHKRWLAMRARCLNPNASNYPRYGGRGIKICERWTRFENFLADMGKCPDASFSIERINNDGNYEPGNCRWATRKDQNRNTSWNRRLTYNGETMPVSAWAEKLNVPAQTILNRLRYGWTVERTLSQTGDARTDRKKSSRRKST